MVNCVNSEEALREEVEKYGNISWAGGMEQGLEGSYRNLVDRFGNRLNDSGKETLIRAMIRNTGYSCDTVFEGEIIPPVTVWNDEGNVACIYNPDTVDIPTYSHEGIHFLAHYGPKADRLIHQDVPLANVIGTFVRLREDSSYLEEIIGGNVEDVLKSVEKVVVNPFEFSFAEHSEGETLESSLVAVTAYAVSLREGEEAGYDYILNLMKK